MSTLRMAGMPCVQGQANLEEIPVLPHRATGTSCFNPLCLNSFTCKMHIMLFISQDLWENAKALALVSESPQFPQL